MTALAVDAADVTFDDTNTTEISGADVQEALESADALLDTYHTALDDNAEVVHLRADCTGVASCFTTMASLESWIWNTRQPTASAPLLVHIGPGTFDPFTCPSATPNNGHVTLRGAGQDNTTIHQSGGGLVGAAIAATNCDRLTVENMSLTSVAVGVSWTGTGTSTWSNVLIDVDGTGSIVGAGWYDLDATCLGGPSTAEHYFFGSKVRAANAGNVNAGYIAGCSETWFYGGEIDAEGGTLANFGVFARISGDFRAFGTAVRSRADASTVDGALNGVVVQGDGIFHMHGGIINATATAAGSGVGATGLDVSGNGFAHTPGTAFVLKPASGGSAVRVTTAGSGIADSPFLWPASDDPPAITSADGEDLFSETDCDADGDCDGTGTDSHLMVYDGGCTPTPWRDTVTRRCRNDTTDPVQDQLDDHEARITALE